MYWNFHHQIDRWQNDFESNAMAIIFLCDDDNELFLGNGWPMKGLKPHFQPGQLSENLTIKKILRRAYLKWIFCSMRITWSSRNYWGSWVESGNILFWKFYWEVHIIMSKGITHQGGWAEGNNFLTSRLSSSNRKFIWGKSFIRFSYPTLDNLTV